jgi:alkylation response protein AidB-like acyl-CoA dehydrogenase
MGQYNAPRRDMQFVLHDLLKFEDEIKALPPFAEVSRELVDEILDQAAKFTEGVLFPLNQIGDKEGCHFHDGEVTTPKGFKEAYRKFCEAGWPSIVSSPEFGGQGLPHTVGYVLQEMLFSANQAWSMYPTLTHGAYEALLAHGTDEQKRAYLPKLVSGQWTGTMCLTEPQGGSDLGILRTRAEPNADGSYKLNGTKIFVSSGEHDLSENIIHLVLARLPDAPRGTKGISLFIVPKFLPDADGNVGERNGIKCGSIEHKMGIHGNSTCTLNLEDAKGFLVGEANRGLQAMFIMMNGARLAVGMQGLGLTEVAYQNAAAYAKERLQSRSLSGPKAPDKPADPIIVHPDVRRMLLTQKAYIEAGRAFAYFVALHLDKSLYHPDPTVRKDSDDLVALLTPVVKAFATDNGFLCTNLAMQVFGGHGYIQEGGMDQYVRDARINMIYEGTNFIQSLDLLGRKVLLDQGVKLAKFVGLVRSFVAESEGDEGVAEFTRPLGALCNEIEQLTMDLGMKALQNPDEVGAAAADYLRIVGHLAYGYFWARMAKLALAQPSSEVSFHTAKLATARFYFSRLFPETEALVKSARSGVSNLLALEAAQF